MTDTTRQAGSGSAVRLAWTLLVAHAALIVFSTAAMLTVLAGQPGIDVTSEPAATIMRVSFRFAGPTYVVLGALATFVFLGATVGWRRAAAVAAGSSVLALGAELLGTSAGLPFGDYSYSGLLGYRILGLVPFPIPLSWFYMLVASLVVVARLARSAASWSRWAWALGAGLLMVAWDVSMDPAMVSTGHWQWNSGAVFASQPPWIEEFFTRGVFYGMPLANWFGWLLTATLIARVILQVMPPAVVRATLATSPLPVVLYLANGVMPVALCLRDGFWWAATLGGLAMLLPSLLALRGTVPRRVPVSARQAA